VAVFSDGPAGARARKENSQWLYLAIGPAAARARKENSQWLYLAIGPAAALAVKKLFCVHF